VIWRITPCVKVVNVSSCRSLWSQKHIGQGNDLHTVVKFKDRTVSGSPRKDS